MGKFKGIVYLSEQQYREKLQNNEIDEDTQYVTPYQEQYYYSKAETDSLLSQKANNDDVYSKEQVDIIKSDLESKIGQGQGTVVTVGGEAQSSWDADTKADKSEIPSVDGLASETFVTSSVQTALGDSKSYTDNSITTLKEEIYGPNATEALDTINELSNAISENEDLVTALNSAIGEKADKTDLDNYLNKSSDSYISNIIPALSTGAQIGTLFYSANKFSIGGSNGSYNGYQFCLNDKDFSRATKSWNLDSEGHSAYIETYSLLNVVRTTDSIQDIAGTKNFTGMLQKNGVDVITLNDLEFATEEDINNLFRN